MGLWTTVSARNPASNYRRSVPLESVKERGIRAELKDAFSGVIIDSTNITLNCPIPVPGLA